MNWQLRVQQTATGGGTVTGECRAARLGAALVAGLALLPFGAAQAQSDAAALRRQIEEQRALVEQQARQLEQQQRALEDLSARLKRFEAADSVSVNQAASSVNMARDAVGDLNAAAVQAGDFPGAIRIPGTGSVSLAIGGSIKASVIHDSRAETMGADFTPAFLGSTRPDRDGATSIDATLTRLFVDGRAPIPSGQVRGYVEYDLNAANNGSPDFKLRHAYGTWTTAAGTLTAGQTWSTLMDLKILPEGLTEPTVSGVIFARQALMRWSGATGSTWGYHLAIEDPSSSDVSSVQPLRPLTSWPDLVAAVEVAPVPSVHVRLGGIVRRLKADAGQGPSSATASGASLTGRVDLLERDKLILNAVYGKGLGRYLLGIRPNAGAFIDAASNDLELRTNTGVMLAYQHFWTADLRSTLMGGIARARVPATLAGDAFKSSRYISLNLMKRLQPYLTVGIEYAYGKNEFSASPGFDNHRIAVGVQLF